MPQLYPSPSEHQPHSAFQGQPPSSHHRQTQRMVRTADTGVNRELRRTVQGRQLSPELPPDSFCRIRRTAANKHTLSFLRKKTVKLQ